MKIGVFLMISIKIIISCQGILRVIPERANVTFFSKKHLAFARIYVTRHGRHSPYYINVEGSLLQQWTNNVTFSFVFYEYLHNEYRRSFVEMHFKFCDMINSDPYIGRMLKVAGLTCPAQAQVYNLINMTLVMDQFPSAWPFRKCRMNAEFLLTKTKEVILKGYIYVTFIQNI